MAEVLLPSGWTPDASTGVDFAARAGGAIISYSGEEIGWQVAVQGDPPNLETVMEEVTRQVGTACGEPCEWLEF